MQEYIMWLREIRLQGALLAYCYSCLNDGYLCADYILFAAQCMEDPSFSTPHARTGHQVSAALDCILEETFAEMKARRMDQIVTSEMPEDYLKYIGNVSMLLHSHREPTNTEMIRKVITEPSEAESKQLHLPSPSHIFGKEQNADIEGIPSRPQSIKQARNQSICLSHRSRVSVSRLNSKNSINSRRKIILETKLIPLNRNTNFEERDNAYEQKIAQLRKRKVKLQEAMRAFREDDRSQRIEHKKTKENQLLFTTDFKGKVLNFNPKVLKMRQPQPIPFLVKFQTEVESGRSQGNWGKVVSSTRRHIFRQGFSEPQLS